MIRKMCVWYPVLSVLLLAPIAGATEEQYAAPQLEQAIESACLVADSDGSRGSGCVYGYHVVEGRRRGLVITAAHCVRRVGSSIVLYVGRRLVRIVGRVVVNRNPSVDVAIIEFDASDWPTDAGPLPRGVPLAPSEWRVPVGHAIYSVGHPGAVRPAKLLVARVVQYSQAGALGFRPGPELGRSGSAVFTHDGDGNVVIVGVISVRDTQGLRSSTTGYAVTPRQFRVQQRRTARQTGYPTQCGPMGCPVPSGESKGLGDYLLPYRDETDRRIERIEQESQERSQGTLPLPPMAPPVDLEPLSTRVDDLDRRMTDVVERSNKHSEAIGKLSLTAEKAVALAETIAKRDEAFAADLAAVREQAAAIEPRLDVAHAEVIRARDQAMVIAGQAADKAEAVKGEVADALDEENPRGPLGRLRDRLHERIEGRVESVKEAVKSMIGLPTFLGGTGLGLGGIALVIAAIALLRRGAVNAAMGEDTLTQRLAARTSNPYDDMVADAIARGLAQAGDYLPSVRRRKAAATTKTAKK
jgi:hypothetical protein